MSERSKYIGPDDEGETLEPGDEIILPVSDSTEQGQTTFSVSESQIYDDLLEVKEQTDEEGIPPATAYFRKDKEVTHDMIPDLVKDDEGKKFLRIARAWAAAGARARIVIKKRSKK